MNFDKRSIAAIAMCVLFYVGFTAYLNKKYPDRDKKPVPTATETDAGSSAATPAGTTAAAAAAATAAATATTPGTAPTPLDPEQLVISTDVLNYRFSQESGALTSVTLKGFRAEKDDKTHQVDVIDSPMAIQGVALSAAGGPLPQPRRGLWHAERSGRTVRFWQDDGTLRITQEYKFPEKGFGGELRVSFTNQGPAAVDLTAGVMLEETRRAKKKSNIMGFIPGVVVHKEQLVYRADGVEWLDLEAFCKNEDGAVRLSGAPVEFFGLDLHYFLMTLSPAAATSSLRIERGAAAADGSCPVTLVDYDRLGSLAPGATTSIDYRTYFGPKDLDVMKAHDPELEGSVHLGTFGFLARPMLAAIEGLHRLTGNYGVAIVLMTILLKILFYPLVRASSTSMHKMKKLNPQMNALRERYKDNKQLQQQELMKFMMQNKINPMKGCLPILPQIPVFFAFYQVLQTAIQLRHAPFFGWINDLSAMDPFFVTPILMGIAMAVQQKLTPTTGMDKTQEKILMFMPIMFTVMMLTLPAGLTLYMLTNTVVGILQQQWLYSRLDRMPPAAA